MKRKKITFKSISFLVVTFFLFPMFCMTCLFSTEAAAKTIPFFKNHILLAVAPVNPLNPAEEVEPIFNPDSSNKESNVEIESSEVQYPEETTSSSTTSSSSEEIPEKPVEKPKKQQKNLLKLPELSNYQMTAKNIALGSNPEPMGGGAPPMDIPKTQTGQAMSALSGILLYGEKPRSREPD